MISTETARAPSLIKAALVFAATAGMLVLSSRAPAQEMGAAPRAYAGPTSVRIRGVEGVGLTAATFADWFAAHDKARGARSAELFVRADVNRDGRVTAYELKDLLVSLARA